MSNAQYLASLVNSSGNINIPVSNAGVVFNNSNALQNNTLNDYEYGTWTVSDVSGAGLTFGLAVGTYVKIGQFVCATFDIQIPTQSSGTGVRISLPFKTQPNPGNDGSGGAGTLSYSNQTAFSNAMSLYVPYNLSWFSVYRQGTNGTSVTYANLSATEFSGSIIYQAYF
jgi:hypothetical protein